MSVELTFGLVNRTGDGGEYVIGIRTDQANRANYDHENDSQHHCIFRDVLTFLVVPESLSKLLHFDASVLGHKNQEVAQTRREKERQRSDCKLLGSK